jgi:polyribonucleotide nucleotidyltransferase
MKEVFSTEFGGRTISLKTNYVAAQADGAIFATYGDTVALVTAVSLKSGREGIDFMPLTVDYQEMTYAAGKFPGGFFKREGRLNEREILTSRMIDRSIRPLFPKGYRFETQIMATWRPCWRPPPLWKYPIFPSRGRSPVCVSDVWRAG